MRVETSANGKAERNTKRGPGEATAKENEAQSDKIEIRVEAGPVPSSSQTEQSGLANLAI
jgi:hypothetical protein